MTTINELQMRYVALEREVTRLWPAAFSAACAQCTAVCCRQHMVDGLLESPWLTEISQGVHGADWHRASTTAPCVALTCNGCLLTAGKPPFCFQFYCDRMLPGIPATELLAHLYLSFILTTLCRLDKKRNLLELTSDEIPKAAEIIEEKIADAERQLALYRRFLETDAPQQASITLQMLAEMPFLLSRSVRRILLEELAPEGSIPVLP